VRKCEAKVLVERGRWSTLNVENSHFFKSTVTEEGTALAFNGIELHASRVAFDF